MTPVCKYYSYGNCIKKSGFNGGCHILIGCTYEREDGFPSPLRQKRHCVDYIPLNKLEETI